MKTCFKCKVEKPVGAFYANRTKPDGLSSQCRDCERDYRGANIERVRERDRARYRVKPRQSKPAAKWAWNLNRYHGISVHDYERILKTQGGRCAICSDPPGEGRRLVVDHCHTTSIIRGLLCVPCNQAIGLLRDRPDAVRRAANYIEESRTDLISRPDRINPPPEGCP